MAKQKQKWFSKHKYSLKVHIIGWASFLVLVVVIGLQLLYPADRVMPLARLGSTPVGGQSFSDVATTLNNSFETAKITLVTTSDKSITYPLRDTGAQIDGEFVRTELSDYPLWQRLIPFSALFTQPMIDSFPVYFSEQKLTNFVSGRVAELSTLPRNAGLAIKDGQIVATPDMPGEAVDGAKLAAQIKKQRYYSQTTINVATNKVQAAKTAAYFEDVRQTAEVVLSQKVTIQIGEEVFRPTKSIIASWLELSEKQSADRAVLAIRHQSLNRYLEQLQDKTRQPAGQTRITVVNSQETDRKVGRVGREIDTKELAQQIEDSLLAGDSQIYQARFVELKPQVIINNTYTSTETGLQSYISDQVNTKNVQIAVEQLNGAGWKAYGDADKSTVSASTYKIFVALRVLDDIEQGKLNWSDRMLDTDVAGCFERMVVVSLNTCSEHWIGTYGRTELNNYLWKKGFSHGTDFNNPLATHTTAKDLTRYYRTLYEGSLMSSTSRQTMLHALNNHGYTRGIPAGSQGRVHNKVGFLWDYSNDSAIVYHPKGTYAIAILTKGMSFYAIADMTREIERIMYP